MVSTPVNLGPIKAYSFFEEVQSIRLPGGAAYIEVGANQQRAVIEPGDKVLNLVSDNKKLVTTMHISFYHFYMDFVGRIVDHLKDDPDTELIIHNPMMNRQSIGGSYVYDAFIDTLIKKGIKYQVHNLNDYSVLNINNVYLLSNATTAKDYASAVFDFFADQVKNPGITPHRDIFLSRKHMGNRLYPNSPDWAWANHDNRIDDHDNIENYFRSIGYEVIMPESLDSFENQLNTFYEARTIVSTTSSGLTNAVFMQPGQTVIELVTPLVIHMSNHSNPDENNAEQWTIQEELHHFYAMIAFHKKHKFLMLGNKHRKSDDIIKQIEDDESLKQFISRK